MTRFTNHIPRDPQQRTKQKPLSTHDDKIGILTSIEWNSHHWKALPTDEDLKNTKYGYVKSKGKTHTFFNFAHKELTTNPEDLHYALLPQFWTRKPKLKKIDIIFIRSYNWSLNKTYIVGFYLFPNLIDQINLPCQAAQDEYRTVNLQVQAQHCYLLDKAVVLDPLNTNGFLPEGKKLGKQAFNYLSKDNVKHIFNALFDANPDDASLRTLEKYFWEQL